MTLVIIAVVAMIIIVVLIVVAILLFNELICKVNVHSSFVIYNRKFWNIGSFAWKAPILIVF